MSADKVRKPVELTDEQVVERFVNASNNSELEIIADALRSEISAWREFQAAEVSSTLPDLPLNRLDYKGHEILDPRPVAVDVMLAPPPTLEERIDALIRNKMSRLLNGSSDDLPEDDDDDFDFDSEPDDPRSVYELDEFGDVESMHTPVPPQTAPEPSVSSPPTPPAPVPEQGTQEGS